MAFTAVWFRSEEILSEESAETFFAARDLAKSVLAVRRVGSGATRAQVRSSSGELLFDTGRDAPAIKQRPSLGTLLIKRVASPMTMGTA